MQRKPSQPPLESRHHLLTNIKLIVEGKNKPSKDHKISYMISGGPPRKRLEYLLEIRGTGSVACHILDELKSQRRRAFKHRLSEDKVRELFREIIESRLLENIDAGGGFLPDSLVGSISIEYGQPKVTYYFLADEQQRHNQGLELNPSLAKMDSIFQGLISQISG